MSLSNKKIYLGKRYHADGASLLKLNRIQEEMVGEINLKIGRGEYRFSERACPVCNAGDDLLLSEKDRYGLWMPVVICECCGLVRTNPQMTGETLEAFYNSEYRKLYSGQVLPNDEIFSKQFIRGRRIIQHIRSLNLFPKWHGLRVLEIGCGAGGVTKAFQESGCRAEGLDLGAQYVEYGKRVHGLNLHHCTVEEYRFCKPFDLVIYSHVLEHLPEPVEELQRIKTVLGTQGRLYIEVPGIMSIDKNYGSDFLRYLQNAHLYHFSLTSLTHIADLAGFKLVTGDEYIRGIYAMCPDSEPRPLVEGAGESDKIKRYLQHIEYRLRFSPVLRLKKLSKRIRRIISR